MIDVEGAEALVFSSLDYSKLQEVSVTTETTQPDGSAVVETWQGIHPTVFYRWQKQLFENGATAFEYRSKSAQSAANKKLTALEEKLVRKNEVFSELMEEHIKPKKALGDV